jgi:hypothetical protein
MPLRPTTATLEGLRVTLRQLEENIDHVSDSTALTELKRILVQHIAELELQTAVGSAELPNRSDTTVPDAQASTKVAEAADPPAVVQTRTA